MLIENVQLNICGVMCSSIVAREEKRICFAFTRQDSRKEADWAGWPEELNSLLDMNERDCGVIGLSDEVSEGKAEKANNEKIIFTTTTRWWSILPVSTIIKKIATVIQ